MFKFLKAKRIWVATILRCIKSDTIYSRQKKISDKLGWGDNVIVMKRLSCVKL